MHKYKTVAEFIDNLDDGKREQVELLRRLIRDADPNLQERIKWNAPSYVLDGEDRLTFNIINKEGMVKLILHMGATRKENKKGSPIMNDVSGRIQWSSDIRGMLSFKSIDDVMTNRDIISKLLREWLSIKA